MQSKCGKSFLKVFFICLLVLEGVYSPGDAQANNLLKSRISSSFHRSSIFVLPGYHLNTSVEKGTQSIGRSFILHQLYDDITYLFTEPDFYGVVGGISLAPSLFGSAFRRESPEFTELWGPSMFADNFFEAGEIIGNGVIPVVASAASWSIGKAAGSSRLSTFGSDLFRAQAVNGLLTGILKVGINRTRPNGAPYSYPSGHTSSAFALAGTVYTDLGKTWGIPAFILAGYVGLSRLQEGKHYVSDVVAGGILGTYVSLKLAQKKNRKGRISIAPLINNGSVGFSLNLRFN